MKTEEPALAIHALHVGYPGQNNWVLSDASLVLKRGECAALVGRNGVGKSTLLKAVAGLHKPAHGTISVFGKPISKSRFSVAYLAQNGSVDWNYPICVRCFVLMGRYVHLSWVRRPRRFDYDIVDSAMETMHLTEFSERRIGELSGGQQQRVLLARALAQEASLFLLDEPLNAVDSITRAAFRETLEWLRASDKTILMATHEIESVRNALNATYQIQAGRVERVIEQGAA